MDRRNTFVSGVFLFYLMVLVFGVGSDAAETASRSMQVKWGTKTVEKSVPVVQLQGRLAEISAVPHRFQIDVEREGFTLIREWQSGMIKMTRRTVVGRPPKAITKDEARKIAIEFAERNSFPADAKIERFFSMHYSNSDGVNIIDGYTVCFAHRIRDTIIAGNGITMIVYPDGVKLFTAFWHDVSAKDPKGSETLLLQPFDAGMLQACVNRLRSEYKFGPEAEMPDVVCARPAYYAAHIVAADGPPPRLVWEVCFAGNKHVFYDPATQKTIDTNAHHEAARAVRTTRRIIR